MSIKIPNPINSIIVEGLWGVGKTSVAEAYCKKYEYELFKEPMHTTYTTIPDLNKLDEWYLDQHKKREGKLIKSKVLVERSVLSTFAFLYALGKPLPDALYLHNLKKSLKRNNIQLVYLKRSINKKNVVSLKQSMYSDDIQKILVSSEHVRRYDEWFTNILPREFDILPLIINVNNEESRRTNDDLVNDIFMSLACNRTAQINATCMSKFINEGQNSSLVLKRNQRKGGFWQTITGGIHIGEGPFEAVQREVQEEIGVGSNDSKIFWTDLTYSFMGDDGYTLTEYVFGCDINEGVEVRISKEHDEMKWLSSDEAVDIVKFENNKSAIRSVYKK